MAQKELTLSLPTSRKVPLAICLQLFFGSNPISIVGLMICWYFFTLACALIIASSILMLQNHQFTWDPLLLCFIPLIVTTAACIILRIKHAIGTIRVLRHGLHTQARVTKVKKSWLNIGNSNHGHYNNPVYHLEVAIRLLDDTWRNFSMITFSMEAWILGGAYVAAYYLPEHPGIARILKAEDVIPEINILQNKVQGGNIFIAMLVCIYPVVITWWNGQLLWTLLSR